MKTALLVLIVAFSFVFTNCNSHSAEVQAFANERSALVAKMCATINANPTEAGILEARKQFEGQKADLKGKWDAIKKADLSLNALKPILDAQVSGNKMFDETLNKNSDKIVPVKDKFYSLVNDFNAAF